MSTTVTRQLSQAVHSSVCFILAYIDFLGFLGFMPSVETHLHSSTHVVRVVAKMQPCPKYALSKASEGHFIRTKFIIPRLPYRGVHLILWSFLRSFFCLSVDILQFATTLYQCSSTVFCLCCQHFEAAGMFCSLCSFCDASLKIQT